MGLILNGKKYAVLTDIQGLEDALGEMDFKVAGTDKGITAIQMDIKVQGITVEIMREAMAQAEESALVHHRQTQRNASPAPRTELCQYAPRMIVIKINPDKIKDVIGPGGKVINKIIADTGVEDRHRRRRQRVHHLARRRSGDKAKTIVEALTKTSSAKPTSARSRDLMNFGAFVAILPGKEGLVHISQLAPQRVERVEDVVKVGDEIMVKVMEIDSQGRINLSRKAVLGGAAGDDNGRRRAAQRRRAVPSAAIATVPRAAADAVLPAATDRCSARVRQQQLTGPGNARGPFRPHCRQNGRDDARAFAKTGLFMVEPTNFRAGITRRVSRSHHTQLGWEDSQRNLR